MTSQLDAEPVVAEHPAIAPLPGVGEPMTFHQACTLALDEALAADERVFLLGEDITDDALGGVFRVTQGLSTRYGTDRVMDTPIAETAIMGAAIGAALGGRLPVAELMIGSLLPLMMDQLFNHAGKQRYISGGRTSVPVTLRSTCGAGAQFGPQHSDDLEAWLAHSPGLKVVMPSTPADAKGLLTACIFDEDPCIFFENALLYYGPLTNPTTEPGTTVPIGKAVVSRPGRDVTVIGYGLPVLEAQGVAAGLAAEGIEVEIVDLRTITPLDVPTVLESVAKTKRAVVTHAARRSFGVGAEVAAEIQEHLFGELAAPVMRVGAPHVPVPFSKILEDTYLPGASALEEAIRRVLE